MKYQESDRLKHGETSHHPRWALSIKFETEKVATKILGIDWFVGTTGGLTPVALLEPIELLGTIVKKFSDDIGDLVGVVEKLIDQHLDIEIYDYTIKYTERAKHAINITTENGVFSQILLAYVDNATDGDDGLSFDAPKLANQDFAAILYSSIDSDNKKYVIQGMNSNSLNEDEVIKLGFSSTIESNTEYKFSIAQLEGDFVSNNTVYLIDKLSNTVHNLSDSDYTFTSEEGEFNDRFEIRFNSTALSTQDIDVNSNTLRIVELENDNVEFTASNNIKSIRIFDLLGRQLYQFEGRDTSETYKLSNLNSSVYIAKVTLLNGATITKKAFKK